MELINRTIRAIKQITTPRYNNSERGFVGEFYNNLRNLNVLELYPEYTILETEVQKNLNAHYGVRQRPDILIHIPIETGITEHANENNFVVYAFKLHGGNNEADADFEKLEEMFERLHYEKGIFVNINAHPRVFLNRYNGNYKDRMHEISIRLHEGSILVKYSYFHQGNLITRDK